MSLDVRPFVTVPLSDGRRRVCGIDAEGGLHVFLAPESGFEAVSEASYSLEDAARIARAVMGGDEMRLRLPQLTLILASCVLMVNEAALMAAVGADGGDGVCGD